MDEKSRPCLGVLRGSNNVALGYDEGAIMIKVNDFLFVVKINQKKIKVKINFFAQLV